MTFPSFQFLDQVLLPAGGTLCGDPMFKFDTTPLTFDRVHLGHIATSRFPVFKIPVELFAHVTSYLSRTDLKSLALVDRDCCRLAALSLFTTLQVDVCDSSYRCLVGEQAHSTPFIPHCIRQLNLSSASDDMTPGAAPAKEENLLQSPVIRGIMSNSLPNLHILNWDGPAFLPSSFLSSLQSSGLKNLRLKGVLQESHIGVQLSDSPLPLETLCLEVSLPVSPQRQPTDFFASLLCRVASTLRHLTWKGPLTENDIRIYHDLPEFLSLRSLALDDVFPQSDALFALFLGEATQVQSLAIAASPSTHDLFRFRGNIPSLKHFRWINREAQDPYCHDFLTFLSQNPELETLQIEYPISPIFIAQSLLPLLQHNFDLLTSLHLVWDAADIPEHSLRALASLTALLRLWLSAGNQGFRSTWEIDHTAILRCLSPLLRLEILAFSHDTYTTNAHPLAPRFGDYYTTKALPVDLDVSKYLTPANFEIYQGRNVEYDLAVSQQISMRRLAWESWHAERMTEIANTYARAFRSLRWFFIGQLALAPGERVPFSVVENPPQREPSLSSLRKMVSVTHWRPI